MAEIFISDYTCLREIQRYQGLFNDDETCIVLLGIKPVNYYSRRTVAPPYEVAYAEIRFNIKTEALKKISTTQYLKELLNQPEEIQQKYALNVAHYCYSCTTENEVYDSLQKKLGLSDKDFTQILGLIKFFNR